MELHARLVHLEAGLRVVEVRATDGERSLGSALAEASTVQDAEALAMEGLLRRLNGSGGDRPVFRPVAPAAEAPAAIATPPRRAVPDPAAAPVAEPGLEHSAPDASPAHAVAPKGSQPLRRLKPQAASLESASPASGGEAEATDPGPRSTAALSSQPDPPAADPGEEPPADPEDWSQELAALDLQLRRLGWSRDQEGTYLQRAFGHPSRSRLTRYSDLRSYLQALEGLERGSDPSVAAVPLRRSELLAQGDALLSQLRWSAEQGRTFLERELQRVSRQQLSDVQLLQFNMLLEGELIAAAAPVAGDIPGPSSSADVSLPDTPAPRAGVSAITA